MGKERNAHCPKNDIFGPAIVVDFFEHSSILAEAENDHQYEENHRYDATVNALLYILVRDVRLSVGAPIGHPV